MANFHANDHSSQCSFNTEDEYSIISRTYSQDNGISLIPNGQVPQSGNSYPTLPSSPIETSTTSESEHVFMSYHALTTAYEHLKAKFKDLELTNRSLYKRLSISRAGNNGLQVSTVMNTSHENDVTRAWEAYSDKCRECETLRDEVRSAEQKVVQMENTAKELSLRDDVLKAQSQHEDLRKKLQQAELDASDMKNKEELAREELQKEKEYHETVLRATEGKHHEMEAKIADLQKALQEKVKQNQELVKEHDKQKKHAQEVFEQREAAYKQKIHDLEGRVLQEQEERGRLAEEVEELRLFQREMRNFHTSSGLPLSLSQFHQQRLDDGDRESEGGSACSDIDAAELVSELHSLTEEILHLQRQASMQSNMLSKICEDPRVVESLSSLDYNSFVGDASAASMPVQCTEKDAYRAGLTSSAPSIDQRQVVDGMPASMYDLSSRSSDSVMVVPNSTPPFAVSRQIHVDDAPSEAASVPQTLDIPRDSVFVENAFNNIRIAKSLDQSRESMQSTSSQLGNDPPTSYYTTVLDNERQRSSSASNDVTSLRHNSEGESINHSGSSGSTLQDSIKDASPSRRANADEAVVRYPPDVLSPQTSSSGNMAAVWPSARSQLANSRSATAPLWPPGTSSSNFSSSSIEVIPNEPSSSYDVTGNVPLQRVTAQKNEFQHWRTVQEFEVQPVVRPRDAQAIEAESGPHLPANHPTNRPTSRAPNGERPPQSSDLAGRRHERRRRSSGSIEIIDNSIAAVERTFVSDPDGPEDVGENSCPVCSMRFDPDASDEYMQIHANSHFSEDGDSDSDSLVLYD